MQYSSEDGIFLDLKINHKITADKMPVGVILQAMAEYTLLPMATPCIHQLIMAFERNILNPVWLKEQEAKMQEQQTLAETMQKGMFNAAAEQWGAQMPSAEDLNPDT